MQHNKTATFYCGHRICAQLSLKSTSHWAKNTLDEWLISLTRTHATHYTTQHNTTHGVCLSGHTVCKTVRRSVCIWSRLYDENYARFNFCFSWMTTSMSPVFLMLTVTSPSATRTGWKGATLPSFPRKFCLLTRRRCTMCTVSATPPSTSNQNDTNITKPGLIPSSLIPRGPKCLL